MLDDLATILGLLLARAIHAAPINGLSIFGDSLSDPGNNAILFGSIAAPPYNVTSQSDITSNSFIPTDHYATSLQYSNGDVLAYQFAAMLGLPAEVAGPVPLEVCARLFDKGAVAREGMIFVEGSRLALLARLGRREHWKTGS